MPFEIKKVGDKWKIWKLKEKVFIKKEFTTKEKAIKQAKVYMKFRKEKPIVKGNKVITKHYKV